MVLVGDMIFFRIRAVCLRLAVHALSNTSLDTVCVIAIMPEERVKVGNIHSIS